MTKIKPMTLYLKVLSVLYFVGFVLHVADLACEARKISPEPIAEKDFSTCMELIKKLSGKWEETQNGKILELAFRPRREM